MQSGRSATELRALLLVEFPVVLDSNITIPILSFEGESWAVGGSSHLDTQCLAGCVSTGRVTDCEIVKVFTGLDLVWIVIYISGLVSTVTSARCSLLQPA